jgi:hypothetical protein
MAKNGKCESRIVMTPPEAPPVPPSKFLDLLARLVLEGPRSEQESRDRDCENKARSGSRARPGQEEIKLSKSQQMRAGKQQGRKLATHRAQERWYGWWPEIYLLPDQPAGEIDALLCDLTSVPWVHRGRRDAPSLRQGEAALTGMAGMRCWRVLKRGRVECQSDSGQLFSLSGRASRGRFFLHFPVIIMHWCIVMISERSNKRGNNREEGKS